MRNCVTSWMESHPLLNGKSRGGNMLYLPTTRTSSSSSSSSSLSKVIYQKKPTIFSRISTTTNEVVETETRKHELLKAIQDTRRGISATPHQRSSIEEALVSLETLDAGLPLDLDMLNGTWRLQYTSASDVLILFDSADKLPFFQVGQIYQKFECQAETNGGYVRNVVRWSIPRVLEEEEGATLLVSAKFSVVSSRNIFLQFEEITIKNIYISEEVQALITPAILPRTFFGLQILQFIRTFEAQYPVGNPGRQSVGGLYYLSYLDSNILLGRAVGGGGAKFLLVDLRTSEREYKGLGHADARSKLRLHMVQKALLVDLRRWYALQLASVQNWYTLLSSKLIDTSSYDCDDFKW